MGKGGHTRAHGSAESVSCCAAFSKPQPLQAVCQPNAQELFVKCCPTCGESKPRVVKPAGHRPILTKGFGGRGQFDLIDFQSCPDGDFKFLGQYQARKR